ncbi:MAG: transposase [bacterium]
MPQSLANIYIHIIFSSKNHICFLDDCHIRKEMHAYLASILNTYDSPALIVGGSADHIHILCILSRNNTLAKIIGETKRNSSKWIKTKSQKCSKFQWQNGYGAFSVSYSNVQRIRNYISNQEKHHQKTTFKEEFLTFFKKHAVEFDEKYVCD